MNYQPTRLLAAVAAAGLLLGGCGGGGSNGNPPISSVSPTSTGKLMFAAGYAYLPGSTTPYLNVVATYRQSDGLAASLVNTPTITGPFTLPTLPSQVSGGPTDPADYSDLFTTIPAIAAATAVAPPPATAGFSTTWGPGPGDLAAGGITGTSQTVPYGTAVAATSTDNTTFGLSGGIFSQSLAPGNTQTGSNQPYSFVPYGIDVYGTSALAADGSMELPWGGPPAFDPDGDDMGLRDGLSTISHGVVGIPEGFTTFSSATPTAGTYTMSLQVWTGATTSSTVKQTATVGAPPAFPTLDATTIDFTPDGNGGASFTIPASFFTGGITEIYVNVINEGPGACQTYPAAAGDNAIGISGIGPEYYTMVVKAPGTYTPTSGGLPDKDGPNSEFGEGPSALVPNPSICSGDTYDVVLIGTDYDQYGNSLINGKTPPAQVASYNGGQADLTVATPLQGTYPAAPTTYIKVRHGAPTVVKRPPAPATHAVR